MIVPMKKIFVIAQTKDKEVLVKKLGNLGVLHIEHIQTPSGEGIKFLLENVKRLEEAIEIISSFAISKEGLLLDDWEKFVEEIIALRKRIRDLEEYRQILKRDIEEWGKWGNFEPGLIKELKEKNIYVKLYKIPVKEIKKISGDVVIKEIARFSGIANCLIISQKEMKLPFPEVSLPQWSLSKMKDELKKTEDYIYSLEKVLKEKSRFLVSLKKIKMTLLKEKEFFETVEGMGEKDTLCYLKGYIPIDEVDKFLKFSHKEGWGLIITEPSPEDNVPTLLRNPRWIEIVRPLFRTLEILPGYYELDISLWFLIFLSLFFGILIGDAGYGAVYFVLIFLVRRKWGNRVREKAFFPLFYILSITAVIWGLLSGTIFGQEWLSGFFKPIIPSLRNEKIIQSFCFFLGALHLSIAHFWKFLLKIPHPNSLAEIGWIFILWGAYFLARMLILESLFPHFGKFFILLGLVLIIFFTAPQRNIVKGLVKGMGSLFLNLVGSFTDVVSYIRLFAVGLATVAIADSFNRMVLELGYSSFFSGLVSSLLLILGHTLNILLGPMAVLVHGVRLNLLEFCNHLGVKWGGFPYKPFKNKEEENGRFNSPV